MAFSATLPEVYRSIDVAWADAAQKSQFVAKADAARIILQNQTATVTPTIQGSNSNAKDRTVRIHWLNACDVVTEAATDECAAASVTLTDGSQTYNISNTREASFKTSWKVHRTTPEAHTLNQTIATGMLAAMKVLDEYLAAQGYTFLQANNGAHEYTANPYGAVNGSDVWEISAADWTVDLMPQFILSAEFSRMTNAYMLHGLNLWSERYKAAQYAPNDNGKGENNLYGVLPTFWDPVGSSASSVSDQSFLIDRSSTVLATANYFDTTPAEFGGAHRVYKMASRNLPGVFYDVHEFETCTSDDMVVSYKLTANYEYFLNPTGCDSTRTGILQFSKT